MEDRERGSLGGMSTRHRATAAPPRPGGARSTGFPIALTLDYRRDGGWYFGQLREVPDVFSQARTLPELRSNIRDAFDLMLRERPLRLQPRRRRSRTPLGV